MTSSRERRCLSVVVPCYNEEATILDLLDRVMASPWVAEIIVVDDGSTDTSRELLATCTDSRIRVILQPQNQGKGAALRTGFGHATSDYVIVQDADLEYSPEEFGVLLEPLESGVADVVYGSRFLGRHRVFMFTHYLGNRVVTLATNILYNTMLTDMETCYKVMRTEVLRSFSLQSNGFGIEPEMTAKIFKRGYRVYERHDAHRPAVGVRRRADLDPLAR